VLGQPSDGFYDAHLNLPDTLSPGFRSAGVSGAIDPLACFGLIEGGPDGYSGMPSGDPASLLSLGNLSSGGESAKRLRTSKSPYKGAKAKPGKAKVSKEGPEKRSAACESHNQVEKRYRDRLNDKFDLLLGTLKHYDQDFDVDSPRPLSKSDVLSLARRKIVALDKENQQIRAEVERLNGLLPSTR